MAANKSWVDAALQKVKDSNAGLVKPEEVDWKDTNVAGLGSDADKNARKAAANTEPCWANAGTTEGIQIWRVENKKGDFGIEHWPKDQYGIFCNGDSYILLYTYKKDPASPKLSWNIHFWLGLNTSQDESGVAAYKTVELDDFLGTEPVQYREVMGGESNKFLSYFPTGMRIVEGGVASGFNNITSPTFAPRLFQLSRQKKNVRVTQVPLACASLNQGDVFVLDNGATLYVFEGTDADAFEKRKAGELVEALRDERNGRAKREDVNGEFWSLLGGHGEIAPKQTKPVAEPLPKRLYRLNDAYTWDKVSEGERVDPDTLVSHDLFLLDAGYEILVRVGAKVPSAEKRTAMLFAEKYLETNNRPSGLPMSVQCEGEESDYFWSMFEPSDGKAD